MKKRLSKEERQQMASKRKSHIMKLAHQLHREEGVDMSVALKLAHMTDDLLYWLRRGSVKFKYIKAKDTAPYYEERPAVGTLCEKADADYKAYLDHKRSLDPHFDDNSVFSINGYNGRITYWDIEEQNFRTCKVIRLLGIGKAEVEINKYITSH